ncbi:hypothetical protein HPB52_001842 [Rhipicephalus sanguineus]|uniref:Uncharacterized protein n=1 Tax=Rhipicephalus sanguineus TaxID=34632 RepID=A0A9D4PM50_RHISA|nr:hypothetical protein HPB52_001842 [Rhipicephalus sanguineus]
MLYLHFRKASPTARRSSWVLAVRLSDQFHCFALLRSGFLHAAVPSRTACNLQLFHGSQDSAVFWVRIGDALGVYHTWQDHRKWFEPRHEQLHKTSSGKHQPRISEFASAPSTQEFKTSFNQQQLEMWPSSSPSLEGIDVPDPLVSDSIHVKIPGASVATIDVLSHPMEPHTMI